MVRTERRGVTALPTSPQSSDSSDFEGRFYRVLAESWSTDDKPNVELVTRDFVDCSLGNQAQLNSKGHPSVLLALTPQGAKLITDAVKYWQEHNCSSAIEMGLYVLHLIAKELEDVMPHLPEVEDWEPFPHRVD